MKLQIERAYAKAMIEAFPKPQDKQVFQLGSVFRGLGSVADA